MKESHKIYFLVLTFLTLLDITTTFIAVFFLGKVEVIPFNQFFILNFGLMDGLLISFIARIPINFAVSYLIRDYFYPKLIIALAMSGVIIWNLL